jgi:hypothetical protein
VSAKNLSFRNCRHIYQKIQSIIFQTGNEPQNPQIIYPHLAPSLIGISALIAATGTPFVSESIRSMVLAQARQPFHRTNLPGSDESTNELNSSPDLDSALPNNELEAVPEVVTASSLLSSSPGFFESSSSQTGGNTVHDDTIESNNPNRKNLKMKNIQLGTGVVLPRMDSISPKRAGFVTDNIIEEVDKGYWDTTVSEEDSEFTNLSKMMNSMRFSTQSPSIEDISQGRAFHRGRSNLSSSVVIVNKPFDPTADPSTAPTRQEVSPSPNNSSSVSPPSKSGSEGGEWTIVSQKDAEIVGTTRSRYFQSELQFLLMLSDISERLRSVPKPARQRTLAAELVLLNHNLPAEVCLPLWCPGGHSDKKHHTVVRVPPEDAVTLNSAERVNIFFFILYIYSLNDKVPYLLLVEVVEENVKKEIGSRASESVDDTVSQSPKSQQTEDTSLTSEVGSIAANSQSHQDSVYGVTSLSSDDSSLIIVPDKPSTFSTSSASHFTSPSSPSKNEANLEYYKTVMQRRNHLHPQTPSSASTPGGSLSSSSNMPSIPVDEYTVKMRTAAVMLAQLYQQQQREALLLSIPTAPPPVQSTMLPQMGHGSSNSSSPSNSQPGSPYQRRKTKTDFESIRNRLVQEMAMLEEQRLKSLSKKTLSSQYLSKMDDDALPEGIEKKIQVERGLEKDKEDPSGKIVKNSLFENSLTISIAAVFKESWPTKEARIRRQSPYGHYPTWQLISVIVKSGGDLRQEVLAIQLIREIQTIWNNDNVAAWVHPYRILVTSDQGGLIETVQNSISVHSIKKEGYKKNLNDPGIAFTLYDYFIRVKIRCYVFSFLNND